MWQSHLWVVLCVPGSQGDGLQVQFTAQIYSRHYVSNSGENKTHREELSNKRTKGKLLSQ